MSTAYNPDLYSLQSSAVFPEIEEAKIDTQLQFRYGWSGPVRPARSDVQGAAGNTKGLEDFFSFFDFVDVAVVNSWVLIQQWVDKNPGVIKMPKDYSQLDFRLAVIRQLVNITDKTKVNITDKTKVNITDKTKVPTDKTKVPTDKTKVPTDKTKAPTDKTKVPLRKPGPSTSTAKSEKKHHGIISTGKRRGCSYCRGAGRKSAKSVYAYSVCTHRKGNPKHYCIKKKQNYFPGPPGQTCRLCRVHQRVEQTDYPHQANQ